MMVKARIKATGGHKTVLLEQSASFLDCTKGTPPGPVDNPGRFILGWLP
jgi:hypothetical protein